MENDQFERYARARKRIKQIRDFYKHLSAYVTVNMLLLIFKLWLFDDLIQNGKDLVDLQGWYGWNVLVTPILWGIGLTFHGIYVFFFKSDPARLKPNFIKKWEERQIKRYLKGNER